jgi:hypothetical protein
MQERVIRTRQGIVFERIFLQIVDSFIENKEAKASESPDINRETRMSENTIPCLAGMEHL